MPKNYRSGSLAAVTVRLATSRYSPAKQERPSMTNCLLHAAIPLPCVTPSWSPAGHRCKRSLRSRAYFSNLIFQKWCAHAARSTGYTVSCAFFRPHLHVAGPSRRNAFLENRALATGPCALCPQLFQKYRKLQKL